MNLKDKMLKAGQKPARAHKQRMLDAGKPSCPLQGIELELWSRYNQFRGIRSVTRVNEKFVVVFDWEYLTFDGKCGVETRVACFNADCHVEWDMICC